MAFLRQCLYELRRKNGAEGFGELLSGMESKVSINYAGRVANERSSVSSEERDGCRTAGFGQRQGDAGEGTPRELPFLHATP